MLSLSSSLSTRGASSASSASSSLSSVSSSASASSSSFVAALRRNSKHVDVRSATMQRRLMSSSSSSTKPVFDKILIANRGEIACRVIKTARRMGIKTVAVYSEADVRSLHVKLADEAVCIGPAESRLSYLDIDAIMGAIRKTGAQAVHPGYGFLSENAHFSERLEKEGVAFIGPGAHAIHAMGDKIESKKLAKAAGVNVIPGFLGEVDTDDDVIRIANEIGYPVMIKASAGGGGKGMRIAWNDAEAREGFRLSKSEAMSSFGDDRMLIEKFIEEPRHIEIQLLCDGTNHLYLPERECSIQRRNQKVLEEAPSPHLDQETRDAMGKQAAALAAAVDYRSAGTVEFLADAQRNFYFLEMNTRLQVEHPVTESITGLDLVEWMIRVAAGEKLPMRQEDIKINGWAIESRVYAEDPLRGFLPALGRLTRYSLPTEADVQLDHEQQRDAAAAADGEMPSSSLSQQQQQQQQQQPVAGLSPDFVPTAPGVRVDGGIVEGSEIQVHYDPLISKLITYGETRDLAIARMINALDSYVIRGPGNNVNFLRTVMDNERFRSGRLSTKFIEQEYPDGFSIPPLAADDASPRTQHARRTLLFAAGIIDVMREARDQTVTTPSGSAPPAIAPGARAERVLRFNGDEVSFESMVPPADVLGEVGAGVMMCRLDGGEPTLVTFKWDLESPVLRMRVFSDDMLDALPGNDGDHSSVAIDQSESILQYAGRPTGNGGYQLQHRGCAYSVDVLSPRAAELSRHMIATDTSAQEAMLLSPMPGIVTSLDVAEGQVVVAGQEVAIIEAMKMQNPLRAARDGVVKKVHVVVGQQVAVDEEVIEFEPLDIDALKKTKK